MIGFLLFGASAVVFTLIFVTDASRGITSKERYYYQSNYWLLRDYTCSILSDLLFARFYHGLA